MNESKTCRSPHKGTESHWKNKYLFRILPALWCCSRWIHRDRKATERKLHETQVKNLWFYYVLSRITISHGIAVKWFLRVYWLLPLSIVDSFKKHRRFFRRAPTILLPSTDDSFAEHRWLLGPFNQLYCQKMPAMLWIWPRWDRASPLVCTLKERKQLLYQVHLSLSPYLLSADP